MRYLFLDTESSNQEEARTLNEKLDTSKLTILTVAEFESNIVGA